MRLTIDTAKAEWKKPTTKVKQSEAREARIRAHLKSPEEVLKERGHKA
jgi:hypothetical protein